MSLYHVKCYFLVDPVATEAKLFMKEYYVEARNDIQATKKAKTLYITDYLPGLIRTNTSTEIIVERADAE